MRAHLGYASQVWAPQGIELISKLEPELIEGNGYEGRQTSKGELFVKVFGMSRDCEGAHIDFKMVASV